MHFEFATAGRIIFGSGTVSQLPELLTAFESRVLIIHGRNADRIQPCIDFSADSHIEAVTFSVPGEPTIECIMNGLSLARDARCKCVVGIGGGSVVDAAKAVSALLTNTGDIFDYLEVIGRGRPLLTPAAPCIAIPTTAGTGAEVTRNAVLQSPEHKVKVSMRSPLMLPRIALIDPNLTRTMPPEVTAATGLDALTQLLEAFVSRRANPFTDGLCREGITRAARSLKKAYDNGNDPAAREDMCIAGLFGGLALANAGLGAVHGFAAPLGAMYDIPHGVACASMLPHVFATNVATLPKDGTDPSALERFTEAARLLTTNSQAGPDDGVTWIRQLCLDLAVPSLSKFNVPENDLSTIVERAKRSSSMKGNPVDLSSDVLMEMLITASM